MTNYTNIYTYDAEGNSTPHDDMIDSGAWLGYQLDGGETTKVVEIEFDEDCRIVWAKDVTAAAADRLRDYWEESEDFMEANPHPLVEEIKGFSIDWFRYDARRGI